MNVVLGGLQEHQIPRTDGICPSLTAAMGMGGGQIPLLFEKEESDDRDCMKSSENLSLNKDHKYG